MYGGGGGCGGVWTVDKGFREEEVAMLFGCHGSCRQTVSCHVRKDERREIRTDGGDNDKAPSSVITDTAAVYIHTSPRSLLLWGQMV